MCKKVLVYRFRIILSKFWLDELQLNQWTTSQKHVLSYCCCHHLIKAITLERLCVRDEFFKSVWMSWNVISKHTPMAFITPADSDSYKRWSCFKIEMLKMLKRKTWYQIWVDIITFTVQSWIHRKWNLAHEPLPPENEEKPKMLCCKILV